MKTSLPTVRTLIACSLLFAGATQLLAQGTAFTYQGRLNDGANPATGIYDFRFTIYDSTNLPGTVIAGPITNSATAVANGMFTLTLDFGANVFNGQPRWLDISVRTNGSGSFTNLPPRQGLKPSPYAIFAGTSSNVIAGSVVRSLNNLKDDVTLAAGANVTITPGGNTLTIASAGGGGGIWSLNGSSAYYTGGNVGVGTTTPAAALEVNGLNGNTLLYATAPRPNLIFRDTIAGNARGIIGGFDGGLRFYTEPFWNGSGSSNFMAFTPAGNLGIGTASPLSSLHISGNPDAIRLTGPHPFLTLDDTGTGLYSRIQADGAGMNFKTQGAATGSDPSGVIHLDGVGNVGVGTISPVTRLTVSGAGAYNSASAAAITLANTTAGRSWEWHALDDGRMQLADFTFAATRLVIDTFGNVGIGVASPVSKLDIAAQDGLKITGFQPFLTLRDSNAGNARGVIQSVAGGLTFLTDSYLSGANFNNYVAIANSGNISVKNITIRGGADVAEPFEFSTEHIAAGSVVIIDDEHPGKLKLSSRAYDTRVAGVVSGANGINPGISLQQEGALAGGKDVALTGRVYAQADAVFGAIKPGDLLTTSSTPGYAMKVTDHARAQGAILGKAMSSLTEGKGMVLVLVTLQ